MSYRGDVGLVNDGGPTQQRAAIEQADVVATVSQWAKPADEPKTVAVAYVS